MQIIKNFYNKFPFNQYKFVKNEINSIRNTDPCKVLPIMKNLSISKDTYILEAGSGSGWILNGLGYHYNSYGIGIDINSKSVFMSNKVAKKMKINSVFYDKDIFNFNSLEKFDIIISYGVLHHTINCHKAIKHLSNFLKKDGILILGLYHISRKPFLNYFNLLKNQKSIKQIKKEFFNFKYLNYPKNKHLKNSIFYDQVFNPFETQHSFLEIKNLLDSIGYEIISTSINDYKKISGNENWIEIENGLINIAEEDMKNKIMNFGFFTVMAKKI